MYSITLSEKELNEQKNYAKKNNIRLGSAILQNNRIPKIIVTIIKLDLIGDDNQDQKITKEFLQDLPELYTLSFIFPPSSIPEKPKEVWVNVDIDNPYENMNDMSFEEEGDD